MAFNTKILLSNNKVCQADADVLTLCGDTSIDAVGTLKYSTDQNSSFVARSIVDAGYVTGKTGALATRVTAIEGKYLSGATNGIGFTGKQVCLGGNLVTNTTIGGAFTMGFNNSVINLTGTSGININAPAGAFKLITQPSTGGVSDSILVRASDGTIKQIAGTSLGAVTGATNGLSITGQKVVLGGALTGDTAIATADNDLTILNTSLIGLTVCVGDVAIGDYSSLTPKGYVVAQPQSNVVLYTESANGLCYSSVYLGQCNFEMVTDDTNRYTAIYSNSDAVSLCGYSGGTEAIMCVTSNGSILLGGVATTGFVGAQYDIDYSPNFIARSLVDKEYVDNSFTANNGLNKIGTNVRLGGDLTGNTIISTSTNSLIITGGTNKFGVWLVPDEIRIGNYNNLPTFPYANLYIYPKSFSLAATSGTSNSKYVTVTGVVDTFENGGAYLDVQVGCQIGNYVGYCMSPDEFTICGKNTAFQGAKYYDLEAADYRANFVCNSLVDAAYVTGITATIGIQTANNGLTKLGTNVVLGGALTGETIFNVDLGSMVFCSNINDFITIINSACLYVGDTNCINCISMSCNDTNINYSGVTSSTQYYQDANLICLSTSDNIGAEIYNALSISTTDMSVCGNELNFQGLQYGADYSANYIARSLVDAAYVTGLTTTSGIQTASNGLCKSGTVVKLGSPLTENTIINGGAFNLCLGQSGSILGTVNICATSLVECTSGAYSQYSTTSLTCTSSTLDLRSTGAAGFCSTGIATVVGSSINITPTTTATIFAGSCVIACVGTSAFSKVEVKASESTLFSMGTVALSFVTTCNSGNVYVCGSSNVVIGALNGGVCLNGGNGVCLTGGLKLITTPATGACTDGILVWNSGDKEIKTISTASVGDKNNIYSRKIVTASTGLTTNDALVILVNHTAPITITLPPIPTDGLAYKIKDVSSAGALINNITINRNGKNINGGASDALINTSGGSIELVYENSLGSWYILSFVS